MLFLNKTYFCHHDVQPHHQTCHCKFLLSNILSYLNWMAFKFILINVTQYQPPFTFDASINLLNRACLTKQKLDFFQWHWRVQLSSQTFVNWVNRIHSNPLSKEVFKGSANGFVGGTEVRPSTHLSFELLQRWKNTERERFLGQNDTGTPPSPWRSRLRC